MLMMRVRCLRVACVSDKRLRKLLANVGVSRYVKDLPLPRNRLHPQLSDMVDPFVFTGAAAGLLLGCWAATMSALWF
jgi:hypothetical protein